ncbi:MAG: hypothetical protein N3H31_03410 [Candidatus Nezhaarchaeota archaeon]|nr:hypothetical protein [Candidatus Nezhaarchaeota archaeon]
MEPLLKNWLRPVVLVYLDYGSPHEAKVYVVEWMDPRTLYFTSVLKAYVKVAEGEAVVIGVVARD